MPFGLPARGRARRNTDTYGQAHQVRRTGSDGAESELPDGAEPPGQRRREGGKTPGDEQP